MGGSVIGKMQPDVLLEVPEESLVDAVAEVRDGGVRGVQDYRGGVVRDLATGLRVAARNTTRHGSEGWEMRPTERD
jgi:hypothetical protein